MNLNLSIFEALTLLFNIGGLAVSLLNRAQLAEMKAWSLEQMEKKVGRDEFRELQAHVFRSHQ